jgi:hypothetical protein
MLAMISDGEWAEHVASTTGKNDPLALRVEGALTDLHSELNDARTVIEEVHSWAVCGAIASADDMAQNLPRIVEITAPRDPE